MKKQIVYGLLIVGWCLSVQAKDAKTSLSLTNKKDNESVQRVSSDSNNNIIDLIDKINNPRADQELTQQIITLKDSVQQKKNVSGLLDDAIRQLSDQEPVQQVHQELVYKEKKVDIKDITNNKQMTDKQELINVDASSKQTMTSDASEILHSVDVVAPSAQTDKVEAVVLPDPVIADKPLYKESIQSRKINLGCGYKYVMAENDCKPKKFATPASVYSTFCLDKAFDNCRRSVPMSNLIFGVPSFTIGDIFLLSRLSNQGKLYLQSPDGTITDPVITGAEFTQVGNQADLQFLGLLAPVQVSFGADAYELGTDISLIYRFNFGRCIDVACAIGLNIPVICRTHELDLKLIGGNLYESINYAAQDQNVREGTITQFFNNFQGIEDFFYRAVLAPKNLTLDRKQQAIGFGDVSLFTTFDFAPSVADYTDALQVGLNLAFPTASKATGDSVWEVQLGTGAFTVDLFGNVIFKGGTKYFNPTIYIAGSFAFAYSGSIRAPRVVSHVASSVLGDPADRVTTGDSKETFEPNIPGLVVPGVPATPIVDPIFAQYFVTSFSEVDSKVLFFADTVSDARIKRGSKVVVGFGNYFYAIDDCQLRLGLFYDFTAKSSDTICVNNCFEGSVPTTFDLSLFECKPEYAHRISWHAAYKLGTCGEIMLGSEHVVAGRNVFKINEAFVTFVATF